MTNAELNTALYQKMFAEQETYREWLLSQPSEEVLNHTYEYTVREDILLSMEYNDLPDAQAKALLKSPSPLADVFRDWEQDNDFTPFLNIMNEWYAKDTSNKISRARSVGKSRHRNGEAERRFQTSPDRRYKQPCTVDCPVVHQRRGSHWHNDCQQKEKVQQIIE